MVRDARARRERRAVDRPLSHPVDQRRHRRLDPGRRSSAPATFAAGINDLGQIVGAYRNPDAPR
jgi:hypothetical protein